MQTSDRSTQKGEADAAICTEDPLTGALQALYRACQKTLIYPAGHPSIPGALALAAEGLGRMLTGRSALRVGVARDRLLLDQRPIDDAGGGVLRSLAQLFDSLDLVAVEFHRGLDVAQLETFVQTLSRARTAKVRGDDLRELLGVAGVRLVDVIPLDYDVLSFEQGVCASPDGSDRTEINWDRLVHLLTEHGGENDSAGLARLAESLDQRIVSHEGTGSAQLRRVLHRAVARLDQMDHDPRKEGRGRLAVFVSALSPGLRRDLLRVEPCSDNSSLRLLHELSDALPASELLEALEEVDRCSGRAPEELLMLMSKLVRISHDRPIDHARLRETMEGWGIPPEMLYDDSPDLSTALQEMFRRRADGFNPQDYQAVLEDLSRKSLSGIKPPSAVLYRNPADPLDVRLHAAELAVLLLGRSDEQERRSGLYAHVSRETELLLDHGRFTTVHEATIAARTDSLVKTDRPETRRWAESYLAEFKKPRRIGKVLRFFSAGGPSSEETLDLLRLGGPEALDQALDLLTGEVPDSVTAPMSRFLLDAGPDRLSDAIEHRLHRSWSATKPLLTVLAQLPPSSAIPLLEKLLNHSEFGVRRDALNTLCAMNQGCGISERYLTRALGDPSPRVVLAAIQRLVERAGAVSPSLVGGFLSGHLPCGAPHSGDIDRLVDVLLRSGDPGRVCLARVVEALSKGLYPPQAGLARSLAAHLDPQDTLSEVREAMRRFKRSTGRWVGLVAGLPGPWKRRGDS